jgi:hypothetical protein
MGAARTTYPGQSRIVRITISGSVFRTKGIRRRLEIVSARHSRETEQVCGTERIK